MTSVSARFGAQPRPLLAKTSPQPRPAQKPETSAPAESSAEASRTDTDRQLAMEAELKSSVSSHPSAPLLSRHKREAAASSESARSSRAEADQALAMAYHTALLRGANREKNIKISPIAPHSTFGQWWGQLKHAFQSPEILQWIREKGINTESIELNPQSGQISFTLKRHLDPEQKPHTLGQDDRHWAAISGPILQAGQVIAAGDAGTAFTPPATFLDEPVPSWLVGRFYKERLDLTGPAMRRRAEEIDRDQGFKNLDPGTSAGLIKSRSADALQNHKAQLGDIINRHQVIGELRHLAASVENGIGYVGQIQNELKQRKVFLAADGTYRPTHADKSNGVSLLHLLKDHGWDIPANHADLVNLAASLATPTPKSPANGNLGGALAWALPLDQDSQAQLSTDIRAGKFGDVVLSPFDNVLDYLLNGRPISPEEQSDPRRLIDTLVNSPRGKVLGGAIQETFEARSVKGSASDWLLAALNVERDSGAGDVSLVEGYRLVSAENTGKSASAISKELAGHLVATGSASSPEKAAIKAYLLLANRAPEFLVKDIPNQVVAGTHSWVSLVTATARIEARAPGATAAMSYAQVMLESGPAPITDQERRVEYAAQNEAIKAWGVASGMRYPVTSDALNTVRESFSAQVRELREAAQTQLTEMPTTRAIALEQLKQALPDMDPALFDEKNITVQPSNRYSPGPYSILDLYIDGRGLQKAPDSNDNWGENGRSVVKGVTLGLVDLAPDGRAGEWVSSSNAINIRGLMATLKALPRPNDAFKERFSDYSNAVQKTTSAQLKLLISKLPLEDRQDLEFGKLTLLKEIHHHGSNTPSKRVTQGVLLLKTERNGKAMVYEIDRLKGTVTRAPNKGIADYHRGGFSGSTRFDDVRPAGQYTPGIADENKSAQGAPNSFSSARTQYIVDAMIEDMDLPAVERYAKGETTFDTEVLAHEVAAEVGLNLIPFRSAINNFTEGNVGDGLSDLAFDVFGFAVGLGAAAKGAKALAVGASALSKASRAGKIIGRAAVGALNPLGGIDDVARGVVTVGRKGLVAGFNGLVYLRDSHRGLNLLELAKKPDLAEGAYKAANGASQSKVLAKFDEASGQWFAFDPPTKQAYGKPLENFVVDASPSSDLQSLRALGGDEVAKTASQQHGLAATGTFKVGQETLEGNAVIFQGNWHQYDAVKKRAFGPPLRDFKPSQVAAKGEVKSLNTDLLGYDVKHIALDELKIKGMQGNVYVGRSKKEYVKVDGKLYRSNLKDGQRVIRHPAGTGPDIRVKDLGVAGWEPVSRGNSLRGGAGALSTPWKLGDSTYVMPMDDIKVTHNVASPYAISYKGVDHNVIFDSSAGAWKDTRLASTAETQGDLYFWRSGKGKWQRGPFDNFIKAKKVDAHKYQFVDVPVQSLLSVSADVKPLPKELHYFWAGQDIPSNLIDNMSRNATKAPGYQSVLHVDADTPAIFQQIKSKLEGKAPGLTVLNLHEDEVFKQMKSGEMYDYFRQGQGKNLAAASDVARYPIMNKYGGIYLDTDDVVQNSISNVALKAGTRDVILNKPVAHSITDYKTFYNTSNFATQPGNPVIADMVGEMNKRFADNKAYFAANRPTVSRGADGKVQFTDEFNVYERKIFDTVGPNLFNDTLKSQRPDMYYLGFDGQAIASKVVDGKLIPSGPTVNIEENVRKFYATKGVVPPDSLGNQIQKTKEHYYPLFYQFNVKIGAEHSWINT